MWNYDKTLPLYTTSNTIITVRGGAGKIKTDAEEITEHILELIKLHLQKQQKKTLTGYSKY